MNRIINSHSSEEISREESIGLVRGTWPLEKGTTIKNAPNTANQEPREAGTWIGFWKWQTGHQLPEYCPICGRRMMKEETFGCHIKYKGNEDNQYKYRKDVYIIPACQACNNVPPETEMKLMRGVVAVEVK